MMIQTKYNLLDRVWISELRVPAIVLSIFINDMGTQYSLMYFNNGAPQTTYFYEMEITNLPENEQPGFSPKEQSEFVPKTINVT